MKPSPTTVPMQLQSATHALTRILNVHPELTATLGIPVPDSDGFRTTSHAPTIFSKHADIHLVAGATPRPPVPKRTATYLVSDDAIDQNANAVAALSAEGLDVIDRRAERVVLQAPDGNTTDILAIGHLVQSVKHNQSDQPWSRNDLDRLEEIHHAITRRPVKEFPKLTSRPTLPGRLSIERMRAEIDPDDEDMMPPFQLLSFWIREHCPRVHLDYTVHLDCSIVHRASGAPVGTYCRDGNHLHLPRCTSLELDIARSLRTDLVGEHLFEVPHDEPVHSNSIPIASRHVLAWTDDDGRPDRDPSTVALRTWANEHNWHYAERWPMLSPHSNPATADTPPTTCAAIAIGNHGVLAVRHADHDEPSWSHIIRGTYLSDRIEALLNDEEKPATTPPIHVITIAPGAQPLYEDIAVVPEIDHVTMLKLTRAWNQHPTTPVRDQENAWDQLLAPIHLSLRTKQGDTVRIPLENPEHSAEHCHHARYGSEKILAEALAPHRTYLPSYTTVVCASALRQVVKAAVDERLHMSSPPLDQPLKHLQISGYFPGTKDNDAALDATSRLARTLLGPNTEVTSPPTFSRTHAMTS